MNRIYVLITLGLLGLGLSCQRSPEIISIQKLESTLTELGANRLPVNFYCVSLAGRTSVNALSISGNIQFDNSQIQVREYGFCLSPTDSLPIVTTAQRIKATTANPEQDHYVVKATLTDLMPGQTYYVDPYVILTDGRVLYGRHNQINRDSTNIAAAISFRLPERPVLRPVQLITRASVPTPPGVSNTSPLPNFHQFFTLKGQLYSFYPTGALHAYDTDADRWDSKADLGKNVFGTAYFAFTVSDKLYVYSGYWNTPDRPAPSMWEYDPSLNRWTNLGELLGENLSFSRYQLSTDGKAYFYSSYPNGILGFDARLKRISLIEKAGLVANTGPSSYVPAGNNEFYNSVWVPGGSVAIPGSIRTRLVKYNAASDQVTEATQLSTQLRQLGYNNLDFLTAQTGDILVGYGSVSSPVLNPGSVKAQGSLFKDELLRYSTQEQRVTAYYDLSALPNSQAYSQLPILVDNRLYIFNASTDKGLFTEVVFK